MHKSHSSEPLTDSTPRRSTALGRRRLALGARRGWRTGVLVSVAIIGGVAAALFARVCDLAMHFHARLMTLNPWLTLALLPVGFPVLVWITGRFAPEAAGSGIPQVIAAAEQRWRGRWGGKG